MINSVKRDLLKSERLTIMVCCNDPDSGMFDGVARAIECGDSLRLSSRFLDWAPRLTLDLSKNCVRIGGSPRVPVFRYKRWVGNWCWDAIVTDGRSALILLNWLKKKNWYNCDEAEEKLFNLWETRDAVFNDEMFRVLAKPTAY